MAPRPPAGADKRTNVIAFTDSIAFTDANAGIDRAIAVEPRVHCRRKRKRADDHGLANQLRRDVYRLDGGCRPDEFVQRHRDNLADDEFFELHDHAGCGRPMHVHDYRRERADRNAHGWRDDERGSDQLMRGKAALIAGLVAIAGCSGGGSVPRGQTTTNSLQGSATFTISVPKVTSSSAARTPQYVSPNTGSLRISFVSVNGSPPSPPIADTIVQLSSGTNGCSTSSSALTCTVTLGAPVGSDVFALTIYQSADATGSALATSNLSATITANTANNLSITLGGVVSTITLSPNPMVAAADGSTHTFTLGVTAKDASGATIIAPGNYSSAINLAVSGDANGAIQLSSSQLTAPPNSGGTNSVTVTYDASKTLTSATITASASGATSATASVNPIVYSPANLNALVVGGSNGTISVSEAGYTGVFTVSGAGSLASVSCSPVSCAPASAGGTVTVTVAPSSAGTGTLTLTDTHSVAASVSLKVASTSGGIGVPGPPVITEFSAGISAGSSPEGITAGPDGNLWFTERFGNRIGRITPSGTVTEFSSGISANSQPYGITAGPDGNLWFAEYNGNRIGRITPSGTVTEFSSGISASSEPDGITAGPDGNLWFTEFLGNRIGRISPSGTVTEFFIGFSSSNPVGITAGPDGNLWFAERTGNRIGRIIPNGTVIEFSSGISASSQPYYILSLIHI